MQEVIGIVKEVELFQGLTDAQMQQLAAIAQPEVYPAGAVIFSQNDIGDKMYIVQAGQVEVQIHNGNDHPRTALFLGRGQVFGEMALVDEGNRSATVIAIEDETVVYTILQTDFRQLCEDDTRIGYILMRNIAQDMSFKLRHRHLDPSENKENKENL